MNGFDTLTALIFLETYPKVQVSAFVRAHAPIGNILWTDLFYADYVTLDAANCLSLTPDGRSMLAQARAYAAGEEDA